MSNLQISANHRILVVDNHVEAHEDICKILGSVNPAADADDQSTNPAFELTGVSGTNEALEKVVAALKADAPYAMLFLDLHARCDGESLQAITELWRVDEKMQMVLCVAGGDHAWVELIGCLGYSDRLLILKNLTTFSRSFS